MSCKVAANQRLYRALLKKANKHSSDDVDRSESYKVVAGSILNHTKSIYDTPSEQYNELLGMNTRIHKFIIKYLLAHPLESTSESTSVNSSEDECEQNVSEPTCIVPSNQPIYEALLEKAKSYPEDQVYQKKAYEKVANNLLTFEKNLHSLYTSDVIVCLELFPVPGAGYSITKFIKEFIETSKPASNETTSNKVEVAVNRVTLPGPLLTTTTTYTTIDTTQSLDDILKSILGMNERVTSNPPKPEPEPEQRYAQSAMDEARRLAAQNAPKVEVPEAEAETRRSGRIARMPKKSYRMDDDADSEDYPDDAEIDDSDEDYVPEEYEEDEEECDTEIMALCRKYMNRNAKGEHVTASDLKVMEESFNKWYEENKDKKISSYSNVLLREMSLSENVIAYMNYSYCTVHCGSSYKTNLVNHQGPNVICDTIVNYFFRKAYRSKFQAECEKQKIICDDLEDVLNRFQKWFFDPVNKDLTERYSFTDNTGKHHYTRLGYITCIRNYLKTLSKKLIV